MCPYAGSATGTCTLDKMSTHTHTLPQGEAQKINKIMEIFALEYFKHNKEDGAVQSEDAAYILSFAIMMLHTALHNPSVEHNLRQLRESGSP